MRRVAGATLRGPPPVVNSNRIHGVAVPTVGSDPTVTGSLVAGHLLGLPVEPVVRESTSVPLGR
jgi:hypothetical protein